MSLHFLRVPSFKYWAKNHGNAVKRVSRYRHICIKANGLRALFSFLRSPSEFPHSRMWQSYHCPVSTQSRSPACLPVLSRCTVLNFCRTLYRPDRTCAVRRVPHRCRWKFATVPVDRMIATSQLETHFHFDPWRRRGSLLFDICLFDIGLEVAWWKCRRKIVIHLICIPGSVLLFWLRQNL